MEYFDFNKNMSDFAKAWFLKNGAGVKKEDIPEKALELIAEWRDRPVPGLSGKSPAQYFEGLADGQVLPHLFFYASNKNVPELLSDELRRRPALCPEMLEVIKKGEPGELTETLILAIKDCGFTGANPLFADWLFDPDIDPGLGALAAECLLETADKRAFDDVDSRLQYADDRVKPRVSDFVVYAPSTANGYNLIMELFLQGGEDQPLYASYLGMYGNPAALPGLLEAAADCGYVAFVEIANAVERLGGEVVIERDFSADPDYVKLKG